MKTSERLKIYLERIKKDDFSGKKINSFLELNPNAIKQAEEIDRKIKRGTSGKLAGKIIGIKSNINVKDMHVSCASHALENYVSPYDATVIKKIKEEDGLIIGMTNCDEFACGSSGETSAFGVTKNPKNLKLIPGGSSSGSAAAVSANFCDLALGSDTGGSIRNPASNCGVVGLKPSYGAVSRYGLIDLSMSLDQIGVISKTTEDAALLFSIIQGKDEKDTTTKKSEKINLSKINKIPKKIKIGILDFPIKDKRIKNLIEKKIKKAEEKYKWEIKKIKIKNIELAVETYYPLVYVEFFSSTKRIDGRRYGKNIEKVAGEEVLRRIFGGKEISKAEHKNRTYYLALKVKKLIEKEFSDVFKEVDCIISPTVPKLPHKLKEKISVEEMYDYDALTIPSNLAGNCSISLPTGEIDKSPIGMQIICDKFEEEKLLRISRAIEKLDKN